MATLFLFFTSSYKVESRRRKRNNSQQILPLDGRMSITNIPHVYNYKFAQGNFYFSRDLLLFFRSTIFQQLIIPFRINYSEDYKFKKSEF